MQIGDAILFAVAGGIASWIAVAVAKWTVRRLYRLAKRTIKLVGEFREFLELRARAGQELLSEFREFLELRAGAGQELLSEFRKFLESRAGAGQELVAPATRGLEE